MTPGQTDRRRDEGNGTTGADAPVVLETRGITKTYGEGEAAVHALRESEFLVLLGASGSGKSTLMNIMGGLDRPTDGEVRFRGDDLSAADDSALTEFRRNHVGFVFQFYNLMPGPPDALPSSRPRVVTRTRGRAVGADTARALGFVQHCGHAGVVDSPGTKPYLRP